MGSGAVRKPRGRAAATSAARPGTGEWYNEAGITFGALGQVVTSRSVRRQRNCRRSGIEIFKDGETQFHFEAEHLAKAAARIELTGTTMASVENQERASNDLCPEIALVGGARLELATNGLKVRCSTD